MNMKEKEKEHKSGVAVEDDLAADSHVAVEEFSAVDDRLAAESPAADESRPPLESFVTTEGRVQKEEHLPKEAQTAPSHHSKAAGKPASGGPASGHADGMHHASLPTPNRMSAGRQAKDGTASPGGRGKAAALLVVAVLLTASTLRSPITGVGPLIGEIQASTGLSHTAAGMLTTLPLLAFAIFALTAPKLAGKLGSNWTLLYCMLLMTAGIVIRSLPGVPALFGGMALVGTAIAVANVIVPSLIKKDFPLRLGLMTALYTSMMNLFSGIASGISLPLSRTGLGWRGSLGCWAILSAIAAVIWFLAARSGKRQSETTDSGRAASAAVKPKAQSAIWRSPIAWQVTLFMASQSIMFYVGVSWLPEILNGKGLSMDQAGWMLTLMQLASMIGSFLMPLVASRAPSQKWLAAASSALFLVGYGGIWLGPALLALPFILLVGLGCGTTFSLVVLFFSLRTRTAERAAELSGMAQSLGYLLAATGPTLFGFIHDQTGGWSVPLAVITVLSLITIVLGYTAGRKGYVGPEHH